MNNPQQLITENLNIWTAAIKKRGSQGRGSSKKIELHGIKKLRELILELAVRGLLVPQNPNDESASVLLEKIAAEKAQLIEDGKFKKQKSLPEITDVEKPFKLPKGWEWARLGDVTNYGVADKAEPSSVNADTWVLELEDVEKESSKLLQKVRFNERKFKSSKNIFFKGDVIYGKLRPYLDKVLIADENGVCTTEMIPVRSHLVVTASFLRIAMKAPYFKSYANNSTHGMNLPRMGTDKARLALIPILSEAEQPRIVAKVDELMALCDQLEQQTENSLTAHQTLVETLLNSLLDAAQTYPGHASGISDDTNFELKADTKRHKNKTSNDPFQHAWQRIWENFDVLFTTEHSIDQLKQTILQLAVMGKLVPQNPNDEPASVLLEKIAAEKEQLIKDKKIKKQKPLPEIDEDEKPFELPKGWEWARLGGAGVGTTGKTPKTSMPECFGGEIPFIGPGQITPSGSLLETEKTLTEVGIGYSTEAIEGDVLMVCIGGSIGKAVIADKRLSFNQQLNALRPIISLPYYLYMAMSTLTFYKQVLDAATGSATPIINRMKWEELLVPLAPEAEQPRIVAKVDELMALCDTLKERIRESQTTQLHLTDAMAEQALS